MHHGTTPPVLKVNLLDLLEGPQEAQKSHKLIVEDNYSLWGVGGGGGR